MNAGLPDIDHPDDDPWLWLEEVDGARALEWVDARTAATVARLDGPEFRADRDTLLALMDRPDNLPWITRRGGLLYNFWKDAAHPRGLWRRTTLASYREVEPAWDVLLDLDALAAEEGEDWIWQGAGSLPPDHERAVLRLSRGGGDAAVLREFDLPTRSFVPDGFVAPEAKGGAGWLDRDTMLLSSALGGVTRAGYARTVRLWARGTDPADAPVLFETDAANMSAWAAYDRETGRVVFVEKLGFFDAHAYLGTSAGPERRIEIPTDGWVAWHDDWLVVKLRTPWTVGDRTHAGDSLLGIGFDAFMAGARDFATLFTPGPRRVLQGFFWSRDKLVLNILDDLQPRYRVLTPGNWENVALHGMLKLGTLALWPLDSEGEEQDGTLLSTSQNPLMAPSLTLLSGEDSEVLKRVPASFDPAGMVVTRHEAISSDGERIPYIQVGPPGLTGEAPVHLSGYGGFGVSMLPIHRGGLGRLWLQPGGTAVVANIRGGGEFGTPWHDAGRRGGKVLSHDDFAAVAADLVARGVTRPGRIAAEGGSNGGLLIANMLTRYPERFGALFCTIPLIDMRRYARLTAGASWIAEYGDPELPEEWAFLRAVSAYHNAAPGRAYPPILIATARRDDRVHPGHARKMAAKLQAMGYDSAFYEPEAGGHGYGKDNSSAATFMALGLAFLKRAIGWA